MKINEIISEGRGPNPYAGYTQQQFDIAKSNLDTKELNILKQYKEELLQKLEQRGISPDLVGSGVAVSPDDSYPLQTKLDIYRKQVQSILDRLKSDSKSFVQPGAQHAKQKQRMRKMSGPVINIPVDQFNR